MDTKEAARKAAERIRESFERIECSKWVLALPSIDFHFVGVSLLYLSSILSEAIIKPVADEVAEVVTPCWAQALMPKPILVACQVATMPTALLRKHVEEVRQRGADTANLELTLFGRTANAAAILVMTLIGVSIAARRMRGGMGLHLFAAVLIGFTYVFSSKVIAVWAASAAVPLWFPLEASAIRWVAAWLPNLLFALLGGWLYWRAPK